MSTILKNVPSICHSCLRFTRTVRRIPTPTILPRSALLHSARNLSSPVNITRQLVGDDLFSALSDSKPISENLIKLAPSDIISLKEHLDSGDLVAACDHIMNLGVSAKSPEESNGSVTSGGSSLGNYISDTTLQPVIGKLFENLIADGGKTPNVPRPLELLERIGEMGIAQTSYYTVLLVAAIKDFATVEDILPVFEAAIDFNADNLREVMQETSELDSFKVDTATPHFLAFLILRDLSANSESITRTENVIRNSPYPTPKHIRHFLDHHGFPADKTQYLLNLLESYSKATLFTNHHTLTQAISQATTPEALKALYIDITTSSPTPLTAHIYTRFATSFLELKHHTEALTCWNDMTRAGISPTVIQWNELMKSFSKNQNKIPISALWKKMVGSGCIPDHHCWTTRIHALLDGNNPTAGLASLREMQASGITPTTETINAAIDGLLKHNHFTEAAAVLDTAEKLGIRKDLWTYNTLLRSLMKQQRTDSSKISGITALTREMQSNDIVPDIQTVTLILDGMYKYSSPRPSLPAVLGFLAYIESVGININIVTYTSIIHALLEEGNEAAAMGILDVMANKGIMANSATYTVLLRYYFRCSDLVSAEKVLVEMEQAGVQLDPRTYREIVCGFAACRRTDRMKFYLVQLWEKHVAMPLVGYMSMLRILGKHGLLLEAKEVVEEMLKRGVVSGSKGDRFSGERDFWSVVGDLGGGAVMRELEKEGLVDEC